MTVSVIPLNGIPEAEPGDDVSRLIVKGLRASQVELWSGDVLVVTHKLVSKAEGRIEEIGDSPTARQRLIEREAAAILRRRDDLIITETRHGFVCANAGVDKSNIGPGRAVLLPFDPDRSARRIRIRLQRVYGVTIGVIITDTFGRAWRHGLTDVAIGVAGLPAVVDYRGTSDTYGNTLEVTEVAIADELAAAADLVMGKARGIPAAVIRGVEYRADESASAADLVRDPALDMFR
ncbi:MAG: coenzyme F420-0:L-glutamate ligase [Acidimicrobiia bacterium]|nr:coenzyme F420-0:L-glutamate ligase [bacterium]MXX64943.1 coenzyme F420-0:L-glutamate ligase [Acidimicrobiia bacterium]MCY3580300.1 coenzyme F420-0:L-glutamate ligase [bacterium]MCY3653088.1 coenzyme F420-0:L-glutamate ligase [bacterium]MXZ07435.1 coenzyme F420-0:L-glutamate ligase [Acidimicrobiia bacterium]